MLMALWAFAPCIQAQGKLEERIKVGDDMPTFALKSDVYGNVETSKLKGKVVLICFFATWCPPCQLELADVQSRLYPKYKDDANFRLIVIGREHTDEQLSAYNEKKKFSFPLYPDPQGNAFKLFANTGIPRSYLFGKDGKLVKVSIGYTKAEFHDMMEALADLL